MTEYRALDVEILDEGPFPALVALGDGTQALSDPSLGWQGNSIPRWNGWVAEPLFDRETVESIRASIARDIADGFTDADMLSWDGDVLLLTRPSEPDWQGERIAPEIIDGIPRWAVGAYSWCWSEAETETDGDREARLVSEGDAIADAYYETL